MRAVKEVSIKKAIAHKLDNNLDDPILSDYELDLDESVVSFITTHIKKSLEDEKARIAKYNEGRNIVRESADSTFDNEDVFVQESKEISRQLFISMRRNRNITSGDVIIALYEGKKQSYLAVLKLDYQSTYITEKKVIGNKTKVILTDNGISLPGIRQKLQKCVFIQKSSEENEYDLLLIDRQAKQEDSVDIAQYFAGNFLNCKLVLNDLDRTKSFMKRVRKYAIDELKDTPEDQKRVLDCLESALKNQTHVNVRDFADSLFDVEDQKQEFIDYLINGGVHDFEFVPDKPFVESKYKIRKIKTNEKIEISLPDEDYNNPDKFVRTLVDENRYDITIKNVKIIDWG